MRVSLTTPEPSRAGLEARANLHHLDELRWPTGGDSGELVRRVDHIFRLTILSIIEPVTMKTTAMPGIKNVIIQYLPVDSALITSKAPKQEKNKPAAIKK